MNHIELADLAINEFKKIDGICKIILYGSVARGTFRKESDIDIAIIIDDECRAEPLNPEGYPERIFEQIYVISLSLQTKYGIKLHVPSYYEDEYNKGIKLSGKKEHMEDMLNEVGIVKFDLYEEYSKI